MVTKRGWHGIKVNSLHLFWPNLFYFVVTFGLKQLADGVFKKPCKFKTNATDKN